MQVKTMLELIESLLGTPARAIPLSSCRPAKSYLLERAGIPRTGTAILFAVPYVMAHDVDHPDRNLSLYAVPRDYHGYMQEISREVLPILQASFPALRFTLYADHSPIREVEAAAKAGLGVLGENGLLITPDYGSFVFLGEIVTDAPYEAVTGSVWREDAAEVPRCGGCGACHRACPAGCTRGEGREVCLSALTQKKGALTEDERVVLRDHPLVWGCDACQFACPHNQQVLRSGADTPISYFREKRLRRLDLPALEAMSDEDFSDRAYAWRGRGVIRRNIELQNTIQMDQEEANEHDAIPIRTTR